MNEAAHVDMDGLTGGGPCATKRPIWNGLTWTQNPPEEKEFTYNGQQVLEFIFRHWSEDVSKLMWCRPPFNKLTTPDGKMNPLFHADFKTGDIAGERHARAQVQSLFDSYVPETMDQWQQRIMNRHTEATLADTPNKKD